MPVRFDFSGAFSAPCAGNYFPTARRPGGLQNGQRAEHLSDFEPCCAALGDAEEVMKVLAKNGITRSAAKQALEIAEQEGRFTIFSLVDALTRLARETSYAGDRTDADEKASQLLSLTAVAT
jgi:hypothetical protein